MPSKMNKHSVVVMRRLRGKAAWQGGSRGPESTRLTVPMVEQSAEMALSPVSLRLPFTPCPRVAFGRPDSSASRGQPADYFVGGGQRAVPGLEHYRGMGVWRGHAIGRNRM